MCGILTYLVNVWYTDLSMEVGLFLQESFYHLLKVRHHVSAEVVKLGQQDVVERVAMLADNLCLLFLQKRRGNL